jgi:hypothetical protein
MSEAQDFDQDPELKAMLAVFAALKNLDAEAQNRVLDYVDGRLGLQRSNEKPARRHAVNPVEVATDPQFRDAGTSGSSATAAHAIVGDDESGVLEGISPVARKWMRRSGLSETQLSILYSLGVDEIDLVAKKVPGNSASERLRNVMLLQGVASYLSGGVARVDNEKLREAAKHYDADVGGNFNKRLKSWASEVSGSRADANLTLTTRGLNSAKDLINGMTQESE